MISSILSRLVILLFGTLYPAYASYKAVRTKNVKEYVKWMMYWIVFALFTCIEIFTDLFLSWFPFYYEIKIILVIWLLSPATKGSSILYRKFVHPTLSSREQEIDEYINKAKEQSYKQVLDLGSKGVSALMQTAIRGGGGLVNQLRKSYSLSDLSDPSLEDTVDETDVVISDPRLKRRRSPHRSASSTSAVYFSEVDIRSDRIASIQSAEDISSGYSSGEGLYAGQSSKLTSREPIHRTGSLTRSRTTRVTRSGVARKAAASDDSDDNEVFETNIIFHNCNSNRTEQIVDDIGDSSSSEAEFLDTLDSLHENLGEDPNEFNTRHENSPLLTACVEQQERLDEVQGSLTTETSLPPELSGEKNLQLLHITKDVDTFSNFLQHLINVKNEKFEDTEEQIDAEANMAKNLLNLNIQRNLEILDRKLDKLANTPYRYTPIVSRSEDSNKSKDSNLACSKSRGGRYNKKAAPAPPTNPNVNPAIKATLVLKPGVLKTIGPKENSCKEIFVQSPKSKRRSHIDRSHSSASSSSSNTTSSKHSLSKLLKLPRKMNFWNRNELTVPKREHRLSDSFIHQNSLPLLDTRIQSKSDNNLVPKNQNIVISLHGPSLSRSGSQLSLKSLTESPLARRRLTIIRRYVDEDID